MPVGAIGKPAGWPTTVPRTMGGTPSDGQGGAPPRGLAGQGADPGARTRNQMQAWVA